MARVLGAVLLLGASGAASLTVRTIRDIRALREAGARVPALAHEVVLPGRGRPCRLTVLGDSAAAGHGLPSADDGLARQVARRINQRSGRPVQVTSLAVDGASTTDVTAQQVPDLGADVEVVVIGVGVNDAIRARRTREVVVATGRLLAAVQARVPDAAVVLLTCPDLASAPGLPGVLRPVLGRACRRVARAQRQVARTADVAVVGADGRLPASAFGRDGFHPGPAGVATLAASVDATLAAHDVTLQRRPKRARSTR